MPAFAIVGLPTTVIISVTVFVSFPVDPLTDNEMVLGPGPKKVTVIGSWLFEVEGEALGPKSQFQLSIEPVELSVNVTVLPEQTVVALAVKSAVTTELNSVFVAYPCFWVNRTTNKNNRGMNVFFIDVIKRF